MRHVELREEPKTIKRVMEAFGKDKEDYKTIGIFLIFTADKKENLSNPSFTHFSSHSLLYQGICEDAF
jgi:hypothetical protein